MQRAVTNDELRDAARKAVVGMSALAVNGDESSANILFRLYISDAVHSGWSESHALAAIVKQFLGLTVAIAQKTNLQPSMFTGMSLSIASRS